KGTHMQPLALLRIGRLSTFLGLVTLALPLPAHAGVHVSLGLPLPVPVFVAPAPVVVAPPPLAVVYPAPVVVGPGYSGPYRHPHRYWRSHHYRHGWRRW